MTLTHSRSTRRLDAAGLTLLLIGLVCGVLSYWLIAEQGFDALLIVPSVVAATMGASHITKREAPRTNR